ncbi:hypothetical protein TNCT_385201 [Trichonephila clavata]|uniref:Uncharacterized protein n=1 Tax=Trichonephila clavata TaxID=2740835 RepID=A0A8X6K717_TRICU|nr:hypothetical protein TNCT_385201 [Trichonephila clavata]
MSENSNMSTCLSDTGNKDLNGDEKAMNRDEDVMSAPNEDISNHEDEEVREEECPHDEAKLYKATNIFDERSFYMCLEMLCTFEPKYLIEELGGFIEFIQSHPELQLDIISKLVFLYIHFCYDDERVELNWVRKI